MAQAANSLITLSDLNTTINNEPRVKDIRIGEALGLAQPLNIRTVIENNRKELEGYGLVHVEREPIKSGKGRIQHINVYYLNEEQCLLICMFSRTKKAQIVRRSIIKVYKAYRNGDLVHVKPYTRSKPDIRKSKIDLPDGRYVIKVKSGEIKFKDCLEEDVLLIKSRAWDDLFEKMRAVTPRQYVM